MLDAAIAANGKPSAFTPTPRHVLLTGATGACKDRRPPDGASLALTRVFEAVVHR